VFTVNDVQRAKDLKEMGVSGVFTDRPDLFTEFT
jgi:glycerophosphoryl diester phosphodiesterase